MSKDVNKRKMNLEVKTMKLIDLTCSKCGATLQVNPELTKCMCQYCGNEMLIDNEVQHHSLDNGFEFGYQAEMGRQQAQQNIAMQQEIDRQNRVLADRQRLLNTPQGKFYWQSMISSLRRNVSDIEAEQYVRRMLQTDKNLVYQYQNGITSPKEVSIAEPQLTDDEYNKLYNMSKITAILSVLPVISLVMGIILLYKTLPVANTNKLRCRILIIAIISIFICTFSTCLFWVIADNNTTLEQSSSSMLNESKGNITGFNTEDTVIQGYTVKDDEVLDDREHSLAEIAGEEIYNTEQIMNESEITNDKYEFTVVLWKYNSTCYLQSECEDIYIRNYKDTFIDGSYTINYIVQLPVGEYVIEFNEDSDFGNKSYNNQLGQFYKGKWYGYNQYTSEIVDSTGYDIKSVPDGTKSIYYEPDDWKPIDLKYYDYMEDEDDRIILEKDNTLNITEDCSILLNFDSNGECPLIFHKLK